MRHDRLKKLAERIDKLAEKDESLIQQALEIGRLRGRAAAGLHAVCAAFVSEVNAMLPNPALALDPPEFAPSVFNDNSINLFQINIRGRILQIAFGATPDLVSTEEFRVPYTLEGTIRCFNQRLLDQDLIEEQLLFYCVEKGHDGWLAFDARTYRTTPFDETYLISLMEQLV